MLRNKEGMVFVAVADILMVYRENKITYIETAAETFTTSKGLNEIWEKLEGGEFFKCHRAYIIRASAVAKVHPYGRWTYSASLKGTKKTALITHEKLEELQELLKL
jgi:DNA-binding LytR/AlgR family response regulator